MFPFFYLFIEESIIDFGYNNYINISAINKEFLFSTENLSPPALQYDKMRQSDNAQVLSKQAKNGVRTPFFTKYDIMSAVLFRFRRKDTF